MPRMTTMAIVGSSALAGAFLSYAAARLRFQRPWAFAGTGWSRLFDRAGRLRRIPRRLFGRSRRDECWKFGQLRRDDVSPSGPSETGHAAFDEYRAETLRRLEQEAKEFQEFLARLRRSQDKAEFDQFLSARRREPAGVRES